MLELQSLEKFYDIISYQVLIHCVVQSVWRVTEVAMTSNDTWKRGNRTIAQTKKVCQHWKNRS